MYQPHIMVCFNHCSQHMTRLGPKCKILIVHFSLEALISGFTFVKQTQDKHGRRAYLAQLTRDLFLHPPLSRTQRWCVHVNKTTRTQRLHKQDNIQGEARYHYIYLLAYNPRVGLNELFLRGLSVLTLW